MSLRNSIKLHASADQRQTRLVVLLPFLVALIVLCAGLAVFNWTETAMIEELGIRQDPAMLRNKTLVYVGTRLSVLGIIGLLVGYIVSQRLAGRLRSLADQAARVSTGDLSASVDVRGEYEISSLSTALGQAVSFLNRYIVGSSTGAMITLDAQGRITSFNPTAEAVLGQRGEDVIGQSLSTAMPAAPENDKLLARLTTALKQRQPFVAENIVLVTRDGRRLDASLSLSFLASHSEHAAGVMISFPDMEEIRTLRASLLHAHGLVTLGGFAAEVAHQFRTPLASISTLLQLLREDIPAADPRVKYIEAILRSSERLDRLINDVLRLATPGRRMIESCDLRALVKDVIAVSQARFSNRPVRLLEDYPVEGLLVQGDRDNLAQALINLVTNAFQAAPDGGEVRIAIRDQRNGAKSADDAEVTTERAVVEISNTGSFIK